MKEIFVLLAVCLTAATTLAQPATSTPALTLQQQAAQAMALYEKHSYAEAASILEKLSADPQIAALPKWATELYNLACDEALAGRPAQALASLKQSFDLGTPVSADHLRTDSDLISLHNDSQFQDLLAQQTKQEVLWTDDRLMVESANDLAEIRKLALIKLAN